MIARSWRAATVVAVAAAIILGATSPAGAGQWSGSTTWGSGTTLGVNHTHHGNVVGLWQLFLSTRYRTSMSSPYTPPFTGTFSTTTENYTKVWQSDHAAAGLSVDGIVGPATWSVARYLHVPANPYQSGSWKYFEYLDSSGEPGKVALPYAIPYATWFFYACYQYHQYEGSKLVEWTDVDLPSSTC